MCGYLTEDESAITVNTPILDIPVTTLKKPTNDCGERTMRSLATDSNAVKRANDKKGTGSNSDNQTLGKLQKFWLIAQILTPILSLCGNCVYIIKFTCSNLS